MPLIGFWQGWEFALSLLTLSLFALRSFAQRVTVSKSLRSLFKKATMRQLLSLHFSKDQSEWFDLFHKQIALSLTKNERFAQKNYIFCMFLTLFDSFSQFSPFQCPKANCSRCSLQKSDPHSLRESNGSDSLFFLSELLFCSLAHKKLAFCSKNWLTKIKKNCISPIVPRGTANKMQMHEIWKKSEIDPPYSVHFT